MLNVKNVKIIKNLNVNQKEDENEERQDRIRQMQLENASNKLLRRHRGLGKNKGIYTESDIRRREYRERSLAERIADDIAAGINIEWIDPNIVPEGESQNITLAELELLAGLTRKQKMVVRLMKRHKKQSLVAAIMKVKPNTISAILRRAYNKIRSAVDTVANSMPSEQAEELFKLELQYKRMLIYRKPGGRKWPNKRPKIRQAKIRQAQNRN